MRKSEETRKQIINLLHYLFGDRIIGMLMHNEVNDISCNPDGSVWICQSNKWSRLEMTLDHEVSAQICSYVADLMGRSADDTSAIVEAGLPFLNARFVGVMSPHSENALWHIRSHARETFSLESYVESGRCSEHIMRAIDLAMATGENIAIIGETGSGKTGFLDALGGHPNMRNKRTWLIEEIPEAKIDLIENKVKLTVDPRKIWNTKGDKERFALVSAEMNKLVRAALLARPDAIWIGEVRGGEFLELLKAMHAGHKFSMFTGHGDNPIDFLHRAEMMLGEAVKDTRSYRRMLTSAIGRVILVRRDKELGAGKIIGIYQPRGYDNDINDYVVSTLAGVDATKL